MESIDAAKVAVKVATGKAVINSASEAAIKMADASSESAEAATHHRVAAEVSSASAEMSSSTGTAVAATAAMSRGHCAGRHRRRADRDGSSEGK
ncbi:MAG: hypothetical protein ACLPX7_27645 [Xanthobacteraceae bacterium]